MRPKRECHIYGGAVCKPHEACECETWQEEGGDRDTSEPECVTPQDTTPPELKAVLANALSKQTPK